MAPPLTDRLAKRRTCLARYGAVCAGLPATPGTCAVRLPSVFGPAPSAAELLKMSTALPGVEAPDRVRLAPGGRPPTVVAAVMLSRLGSYCSVKLAEVPPAPLLIEMGRPVPLAGRLTAWPGPRAKSGTLTATLVALLTVKVVVKLPLATPLASPSSRPPKASRKPLAALRRVTV